MSFLLPLENAVFSEASAVLYACITVICRLAQENEVKSAQSKIRETQKENDELMRQLAKKERECEAKVEETEELMQVPTLTSV